MQRLRSSAISEIWKKNVLVRVILKFFDPVKKQKITGIHYRSEQKFSRDLACASVILFIVWSRTNVAAVEKGWWTCRTCVGHSLRARWCSCTCAHHLDIQLPYTIIYYIHLKHTIICIYHIHLHIVYSQHTQLYAVTIYNYVHQLSVTRGISIMGANKISGPESD